MLINTMKKLLGSPLALFALVGVFNSAQAEQTERDYQYVKRYSPAGVLLGEFSPIADGDGNHPAKKYVYSDPAGSDSRTNLLFAVVEGSLSGWQDEMVLPEDWSGFTVSTRTQYSYDAYGRKRTEGRTDVNGYTYYSLVQYSYDNRNRVVCKAVRMNPASLSPNSQPAETSDILSGGACALGTEGSYGPDRITRYVYDERDNILEEYRAYKTDLQQLYVTATYDGNLRTSVEDANYNRSEMRYDNLGQLERWVFPDKLRKQSVDEADYEAYSYDNNGNRRTFRKRDGNVISYQYDALNRISKKDIPVKPSNHPYLEDVFYEYELQGVQTAAMYGNYNSSTHSGLGVSTDYNGFGELLSETVNLGGTYTVSHTRDKHGNTATTRYPDGATFSYIHNQSEALTSLLEPITGGTREVLSYNYQPTGKAQRKTVEGGSGAVTSIDYDDTGRMAWFDINLNATVGDLHVDFGYNPASQVVTRDLDNDLFHHQDSVGAAGGYDVNNLNQYTGINGATLDYDDNGNLLKDDENNRYVYDAENRLVKVTLSNNQVADLIYDPNGRLIQYKFSGQTTVFVYDGDVIVAEYRSGTMTNRYVHASGIGAPSITYEGNVKRYLHIDHQGSVIAASDSSGVLDFVNTYDAFGVSGDLNFGRFGYTGQVWLPEIGLYHYRARAYLPRIGRFLQTDPVGYEDQMNLYAYVGNDPINHTDSTGMCSDAYCHQPGFYEEYVDGNGNVVASSRQQASAGKGAAIGGIAGGTLGAAVSLACDGGTMGGCAPGNPAIIAGGIALGAMAGDAIEKAYGQLAALVSKATKEGAEETQYALVAEYDGLYPDVRKGSVWMQAGDVWKYGTTGNPEGRYSQTLMQSLGLQMVIQNTGTRYQVLTYEKIKLINYYSLNGSLPPGNRIFK